jgi:uncharacterized protein YjiS (DUF1127 family)
MLPGRHHQIRVCALWQGFSQGFAAWCQRDALYRELAALDARGLQDIGITRADIPAIVDGTFQPRGDVRNTANKRFL